MNNQKNKPRLSEATIKEWFEKAILPKSCRNCGQDVLQERLALLGLDDCYDTCAVIQERFNVRALPYAFTKKSPLLQTFKEVVYQNDADGVDEAVPVLVSDAALSGPESIFILYVTTSKFESAWHNMVDWSVLYSAASFKTPPVELDDYGDMLFIGGLQASTCMSGLDD